MSKDNKKTACFTVVVNGRPFVNTDNVENGVSLALGLHKMSNLFHEIRLTDSSNSTIVFLKTE